MWPPRVSLHSTKYFLEENSIPKEHWSMKTSQLLRPASNHANYRTENLQGPRSVSLGLVTVNGLSYLVF